MEQNIFLQEYFKVIYYLYQLKNIFNILVALLGLIRRNLLECQYFSGTTQEYFKVIYYLYQLKNIFNILVALLGVIRRNLLECQKKILKI